MLNPHNMQLSKVQQKETQSYFNKHKRNSSSKEKKITAIIKGNKTTQHNPLKR